MWLPKHTNGAMAVAAKIQAIFSLDWSGSSVPLPSLEQQKNWEKQVDENIVHTRINSFFTTVELKF